MITDLLKVVTGAVSDFVSGAPWPLIAAGAVAAIAAVIVSVWGLRRLASNLARGVADAAGNCSLARLRRAAVLAGGALGMFAAAYGTIRALDAWGQPLPLAIATSAAIEGGALAFAADLYLCSRAGRDATRPRIASWLYALASAYANTVHPPADTSTSGALLFGLVPLLGLYLIEYQAHAERETDDRLAAWPIRVLGAAWRRFWTAAATWLGVDVHASDTDTERELAARRAARATYRLRLAQVERSAHPESGRAEKRVRRRTAAAQAARERAGVATDPRQAIRLAQHMRELVHGPDHAAGDWSDVAASASRVYGGLVLPGLADSGLYDLTGRTAYDRTDVRPRGLDHTGERTDDRGEPRTAPRPESRTPRRTEGRAKRVPRPRTARTNGVQPQRTEVADLVPLARQVMAELSGPVNRDTVAAAIRATGQSLSAERAADLWRLVKHPVQTGGQDARTDRTDRTTDNRTDRTAELSEAGADAA